MNEWLRSLFCFGVLLVGLVVLFFLGGEVFDFLFSFFFSNWRRKPKFLVNINFSF